MKNWAITEHYAPLECIEVPDLVPSGSEVVVEVRYCGVCHSDLHMWHGGYDLGGGNFFSVKDRGLKLPASPGHEIVGRVVALGPDATGVKVGDERVVYPWIGCGQCEMCAAENDNLCSAQRSLGSLIDGGYAGQVKVPHPRYLLSFDGIDAALAATYACSGLTAYSAIGKIMPLRPDQPVVLIGAGGLGLAGVAMLKALGHRAIVSIDPNPDKRAAALAAGASQALDGSGEGAVARLQAEIGKPVMGVIDFFGSDSTAATGLGLLAKGGRLILIGIGGGLLKLSVAGAIFRAVTVSGSITGSIPELRAVLELGRSGKLAPTPVATAPKSEVNAIMKRLERGEVTGRIVLAGP
jgi:alcohol dehydrogenase/propanol-preferring alcohol dehydrogenase